MKDRDKLQHLLNQQQQRNQQHHKNNLPKPRTTNNSNQLSTCLTNFVHQQPQQSNRGNSGVCSTTNGFSSRNKNNRSLTFNHNNNNNIVHHHHHNNDNAGTTVKKFSGSIRVTSSKSGNLSQKNGKHVGGGGGSSRSNIKERSLLFSKNSSQNHQNDFNSFNFPTLNFKRFKIPKKKNNEHQSPQPSSPESGHFTRSSTVAAATAISTTTVVSSKSSGSPPSRSSSRSPRKEQTSQSTEIKNLTSFVSQTLIDKTATELINRNDELLSGSKMKIDSMLSIFDCDSPRKNILSMICSKQKEFERQLVNAHNWHYDLNSELETLQEWSRKRKKEFYYPKKLWTVNDSSNHQRELIERSCFTAIPLDMQYFLKKLNLEPNNLGQDLICDHRWVGCYSSTCQNKCKTNANDSVLTQQASSPPAPGTISIISPIHSADLPSTQIDLYVLEKTLNAFPLAIQKRFNIKRVTEVLEQNKHQFAAAGDNMDCSVMVGSSAGNSKHSNTRARSKRYATTFGRRKKNRRKTVQEPEISSLNSSETAIVNSDDEQRLQQINLELWSFVDELAFRVRDEHHSFVKQYIERIQTFQQKNDFKSQFYDEMREFWSRSSMMVTSKKVSELAAPSSSSDISVIGRKPGKRNRRVPSRLSDHSSNSPSSSSSKQKKKLTSRKGSISTADSKSNVGQKNVTSLSHVLKHEHLLDSKQVTRGQARYFAQEVLPSLDKLKMETELMKWCQSGLNSLHQLASDIRSRRHLLQTMRDVLDFVGLSPKHHHYINKIAPSSISLSYHHQSGSSQTASISSPRGKKRPNLNQNNHSTIRKVSKIDRTTTIQSDDSSLSPIATHSTSTFSPIELPTKTIQSHSTSSSSSQSSTTKDFGDSPQLMSEIDGTDHSPMFHVLSVESFLRLSRPTIVHQSIKTDVEDDDDDGLIVIEKNSTILHQIKKILNFYQLVYRQCSIFSESPEYDSGSAIQTFNKLRSSSSISSLNCITDCLLLNQNHHQESPLQTSPTSPRSTRSGANYGGGGVSNMSVSSTTPRIMSPSKCEMTLRSRSSSLSSVADSPPSSSHLATATSHFEDEIFKTPTKLDHKTTTTKSPTNSSFSVFKNFLGLDSFIKLKSGKSLISFSTNKRASKRTSSETTKIEESDEADRKSTTISPKSVMSVVNFLENKMLPLESMNLSQMERISCFLELEQQLEQQERDLEQMDIEIITAYHNYLYTERKQFDDSVERQKYLNLIEQHRRKTDNYETSLLKLMVSSTQTQRLVSCFTDRTSLDSLMKRDEKTLNIDDDDGGCQILKGSRSISRDTFASMVHDIQCSSNSQDQAKTLSELDRKLADNEIWRLLDDNED